MPTINIIADAQKAVSETLRFNNELNNLKNRMTELTAENQRYNASGQLVSSTIKGLTNDNQKFTAVLRENKGQMELVNIRSESLGCVTHPACPPSPEYGRPGSRE